MLRLRTRLLVASTFLSLAACGGGGGDGDDDGDPTPGLHAVAAGDVDAHAAVLLAIPNGTGTFVFEVATDPGFGAIVRTDSVAVVDATIPAKVEVSGLAAGTTYWYRVTPPSGDIAPGTFRTAAAAGVRAGFRFGAGGDWRGDLAPYPAVRNAASRDLDLFVALGDTIYADVPSPDLPIAQATTLAEFRVKHAEVYRGRAGLNALGTLRDSTALLATIDDHEMIDDFAGGADPLSDPRFPSSGELYINDTPLFENGLQAFLEYNPIRDETYVGTGDPVVEGETKLYRARTFGADAAVFVLDTRSFRSEMLEEPDPLDSGSIDQFLLDSFASDRTLLGAPQIQDLEDDLAAAQAAGVTWKFVMVPEPIQNLGFVGARDRFEGYAFERSRLLAFIADAGIQNVVFVCADIHGTVVNNLQYQPTGPGDAQVDVDAFEISTPAVAYDPPLGQDTIDSITLTDLERAAYEAMPMNEKDDFFAGLLDVTLSDQGYDATGLDGSSIDATLVTGKWVRAHAYGWSELDIDAVTQVLTVTTWGIEPYDPSEAAGAAGRVPFVLQRFTVTPKALVP
jgi:alkaline phosphatase D